MIALSRALAAALLASLFAAPPAAAAHVETQNYVGSNGIVIVYASNYDRATPGYPDFDVGGNRFHYVARSGESTAHFSIMGGPSTALVIFADLQGASISQAFFCGDAVTLAIPPGAVHAQVFVGFDGSFPASLYPDAPTCGTTVPPAMGTITGAFW